MQEDVAALSNLEGSVNLKQAAKMITIHHTYWSHPSWKTAKTALSGEKRHLCLLKEP